MKKEKIEEVKNLINEGLTTDGAHHKQWYLEEIARALGIKSLEEHDEGIAP